MPSLQSSSVSGMSAGVHYPGRVLSAIKEPPWSAHACAALSRKRAAPQPSGASRHCLPDLHPGRFRATDHHSLSSRVFTVNNSVLLKVSEETLHPNGNVVGCGSEQVSLVLDDERPTDTHSACRRTKDSSAPYELLDAVSHTTRPTPEKKHARRSRMRKELVSSRIRPLSDPSRRSTLTSITPTPTLHMREPPLTKPPSRLRMMRKRS
ncbi:hypothetical protein BU26DRAFT_224226 [Trematosphaeria pertusa]|uniref:Uncharacterized protein n=1 Tax=Trematosphaeria pertusa TaxID=390896 RepID=A0A6A6IV61_9PLEO|nr:uncharacterized protein BU26DRAFT_224226 [Trematosphaeria pertusa]KAF2253500.1 hypothetical protein BU26DRAFT_224226 [Trematosphaeria pertusa]